MAASLLFMLGVGWAASREFSSRSELTAHTEAASVGRVDNLPRELQLDLDPAMVWDDGLDTRLADARSRAWQIESEWALDDTATDYLWGRIDALDADLAGSTL